MKPVAVLVIGALISFAMSAPASAQAWSERYSVRVPYGDLNLNSDSGADAFLNRLDRAGARTCGDDTDRASLAQRRLSRECAVLFTQKGVVRINHAHVTERYIARGGRMPTVDIASM
ncbi:MAG: UrcA family protein [Acidimicrobiia bacterium]|nr:UrcA family protein [Hyphomonadaceae bacterium]MCZ7531619.1 UrcA family protein [Acidimicrobiia bacterium]GIK49657.1 MAG: hypothetical protein BroJett013_23540 [Alphaproteobacteria bacterium]